MSNARVRTQIDRVLNVPKPTCMMLVPQAQRVVRWLVGREQNHALQFKCPADMCRQIILGTREEAFAVSEASNSLGKSKNNISGFGNFATSAAHK